MTTIPLIYITSADYMQPAADFGKAVGHPLDYQLQAQIDAWRAQANATP